MKTYLHPRLLRRGRPSLVAVTSRRGSPAGTVYEMLVYHDRKPSPGPGGAFLGEGREYSVLSGTRISKGLHDALVAEARENHRRYRTGDR